MTEREMLNETALALEKSSQVVCVSHRKPDGDTLGAMLAMAAALEAAGKQVKRFCADPVPAALKFLLGAQKVTSEVSLFSGADTICIFDAGDLTFACLDTVLPALQAKPRLINIDHHATNERFGEVNCVIADAVSATDVVSRILRVLNWSMTPEIATALLCGLVSDTGLFFNPATTAHALKLAAELQRQGGDQRMVARSYSKKINLEALSLWGKALERLKYDSERSHVSTMLRAEELSAFGENVDPTEGLANFLNSTLNARTVLILKELPGGMVKGSWRTAREDVDVSEEAIKYGGGGHRKAAGYRTRGRIVEKEKEWVLTVDP